MERTRHDGAKAGVYTIFLRKPPQTKNSVLYRLREKKKGATKAMVGVYCTFRRLFFTVARGNPRE